MSLEARPGRKPGDMSTWGHECARGIAYAEIGAPVKAGTKAVIRKISTGRKSYRGMASDSVQPRSEGKPE